MATKGERQALLFLAAVALLGAATRVYHARQATPPAGDLDRQIDAVETVARARGSGRPSARRRGREPRADRADSIRPAPAAGDPTRSIPHPSIRIDLDVATAVEIERLPGVGPSTAKRIVADRDTRGPFGCLAALDSVRGIGPVLLTRLDSLVSFSGAPRSACSQR